MLLSVENLRVSYDRIKALHGISFKLDEGEIVCIIGANGAGKSTTLRAISRMIPVDAGTKMTYRDKDLLKYSADKVVSKLGISHVPEGRRLFENLTVMENLKLATFARKDSENISPDLERVFSIFPRLEERATQKSGTLSGGEQQMLVIGRGIMAHPKLMMLDEPSLGLAPLIVDEIFRVVRRISQEEGMAILLVEQNARLALDVADYAYVMENGRVVLDGTAEQLRENEDIKEFYLGLTQVGERKSYRDVKHYKRRKRWLG